MGARRTPVAVSEIQAPMSGNLARYLAGALTRSAPTGWRGVRAEHNLFSRELAERVGYSPAADLVVENASRGRRIWVEFEISRADPVANHAKFAVAHLVQPFDDTFVSMVSTHVVAGRRALCAHAVTMMRRLGLDAFQTSLLPQLDGAAIKRLNHLTLSEISLECPAVDAEWDRLLAVTTPFAERAGVRILLIGDPAEAAWNVHRWNLDLSTDLGRGQWAGKRGFRAVEHFIWWPPARLFAPCKFAAFVPAGGAFGMNMALYASLSESEALFDGRRAWMHVERIGFSRCEDPGVVARFWEWQRSIGEVLRVKNDRPVIWGPPGWAV